MRSLESKRKVLDYKSDNEYIQQGIRQQLGNRSYILRPDSMSQQSEDKSDILTEGEKDKLMAEIQQPTAANREIVSSEDKTIALLKRFGLFTEEMTELFTEQEAGKATVYSSLDEKENAENFEIDIEKEAQAVQDRISSL